MKIKAMFIAAVLSGVIGCSMQTEESKALKSNKTIDANWQSLSTHYDVPKWLVDGKLGVWFHWGIPSATDENRPNDGSWYGFRMYTPIVGKKTKEGEPHPWEYFAQWHIDNYGHPSEWGYEDMIPLFKAEKWDPDALVKMVKHNGARFIMPVATHHDNFDMYDSMHPWNSVKKGPKRDTLREWKNAATAHGLKFGVSTHLYWSPRFFQHARKYQTPGTEEWSLFNMDYDPKNYAKQDSWNEHWYARSWDIISKYDPDMFNIDSPYPTIETGKGLGIKLFTDYINRDLAENNGKQSVVLSFKDKEADRTAFTYNLERGASGVIQPEPWMWATDLSGGWFYRATAVNQMEVPVMVGNAVDAVSKNGVVMLNIALRGDGTVPEKQQEYLDAIGAVFRTNHEGLYGSRPWLVPGEGPLKIKTGRQGENKFPYSQQDIRFTTKNGHLYAFVLNKPNTDIVIKTLATGGLLPQGIESVAMMGSNEQLNWQRSAKGLVIKLPQKLPGEHVVGFEIILDSPTEASPIIVNKS